MTEKSRKKKIKEVLLKHPLLYSLLFSLLGGLAGGILWVISDYTATSYNLLISPADILTLLTLSTFAGAFLVYPVVLTFIEFGLMVFAPANEALHKKGLLFDTIAVTLGILYSIFYLAIVQSVAFSHDWNIVLANAAQHTPIHTRDMPTVLVLAAAGCIGYLVVNGIPLKEMPPLLLVLSMSAMYLGTLESIVWGYQVYQDFPVDLYLLLLPLNCVMITARTVFFKVREWKNLPQELHKISRIPLLNCCNRLLEHSGLWPLAAFLFMWPFLGILICILLLFGQTPDAVIRAWTETSDWSLSRRVAPQNIYYDEHYLCTVAAGGHKKVVKPLRLGRRHGHEVIVNRQLCVANAFEQILEEKTPRFHRAVRHFYDQYGFPLAKLIHSPHTADLIYFLMKPLEWFFLLVLYLTDARPENRIAIQYLPNVSARVLHPTASD